MSGCNTKRPSYKDKDIFTRNFISNDFNQNYESFFLFFFLIRIMENAISINVHCKMKC